LLINIYKEAVYDLTEDTGYLCSTLLQPFAETFILRVLGIFSSALLLG